MIRTLAITTDHLVIEDMPIERLNDSDVTWFWVDFNQPTPDEAKLLDTFFHFHPLAVEDCLLLLQRPKLDYYKNEHFFVFHALNPVTQKASEVDLFLSSKFIVTFHRDLLQEMDQAWQKILSRPDFQARGPIFAAYIVFDELVDQYFPCVELIEDQLSEMESANGTRSIHQLMNEVYEVRSKLLALRRTIAPMRDLFYRIINSTRIDGLEANLVYYTDVYHHLLKLMEMVDSNREVTSDIRDSYLSLNSYRMNEIMKTLTVITTIFMPLTFIAGIYGMNFENMPELTTQNGYFIAVGFMAVLGFSMYLWFRFKGWFR